ncbi:hypothetical protein [Geobacter sulfurreducens]|uniref:hypothetical protein n=1 Tax=Geobacter sulfurreducens TaxID=35554 RepID=UPI000DBB65A5|nr:hypothetical protein [Geobacter sulfurreducens]BBA71746.1 hypothetical protein YM18_3238 [Geobacter sulfurreducens]
MNFDWKRIFFLVFALLAGVAAAFFGQPFIHGNERAINVIVTAFSILAGFLVAIMTIIGDPGLFANRSWRYAEVARKNLRNRLTRQKWMFILYLITLSLILLASLIEKTCPLVAVWLERVYLGTAVMAFILSFGLPSALMNIQLARHDEMIDAKRKASGIK